ncbi:hypothetical protein [Arthrobacter sp. NyZ413]|uniref:hypothetical protein n=1 Tax=Arthrobacter sp. NyZ413 TaxID=3144669 RepID=UPI003BF88EB4
MEPAHQKINEPSDHCTPPVPATGDLIELRRHGRTLRVGAVEAVMPDGTGFWLAAQGIDTRVYVPSGDNDLEIWIRPEQESEHTLSVAADLAPALP